MKEKSILGVILFSLISFTMYSQVKISGGVIDTHNESVPFANVIFTGSTIGTVSDENGKFYLESDKDYTEIEVSFIGYITREMTVKRRDFDLRIILEESSNELDEVVIYSGRVKSKGNPAVAILKKIWARKRQNGIYLFDQYEYEKYEKIEFDMNNIDSAMMKRKLFKGMEFIFENIDTSRITGKTYLPIFINEAVYKTYGNNTSKRKREDLIANKNSGFETNQHVNTLLKDLYLEYNIYANYIKIFEKSFASPLSKTGTLNYNYILSDSAYIDNKWCYNIVYYPRRKSELTFKGDFWVNDTTFAVKEINLQVNKSANINWVKDIYIEQEFDVLNDSVFLLKRDYMLSDFSIGKKDDAKGMYGKRTTMYNYYKFNIDKGSDFYKTESDVYAEEIFTKSTDFWKENRQEKLNDDEVGIYKLLDTLSTVPKFKRMYNLVSILGSGYIEFNNFDYGPIFSTIGKNDVEGIRLRTGGRTYFGNNDLWRLQGYLAYGFKDEQFKYGASAKWMVNKRKRIIIGAGNRRDIEQIGVSLTTTNNILGRSFASSSFFSSGDNSKLTSINLTSTFISIEAKKNIVFRLGASYRTLKTVSPTFNLDYYDENNQVQSEIVQSELDFSIRYTPGRKTVGYGVERGQVNRTFPTFFVNYTRGLKGVIASNFEYQKVQLYYRQPFFIGGFGSSAITVEAGKTFGEVPLGLLSVIPGNQSYFIMRNNYSLLDYYEFVTDTYTSMHLEHNFNGRLFSHIPLLRKLNLREVIGFKAVWGQISPENIALNASNIQYIAPEKVYYEYSAGIANILKVFRIDFTWRGSYRNMPDANNFGVKGSFGFYF